MACEGAVTELQDRHIKSYVVRAGRITAAQERALGELGPKYLVIPREGEYLNFERIFGRRAPLVVEIGFGMGGSFAAMAAKDRLSDYLGIEVHPPGIGACLRLIEEYALSNARIIRQDAFEIFRGYIRPRSVDVLQIFFPDPWPKKRHCKRRLINDEFIALAAPALKPGGLIRLATDWEDYALQMLEVLARAPGLRNASGRADGFADRPPARPLTKFEVRGERLGHAVWDLVFRRD